ncbi:TPA: chromosome partitioning protein ParB [Candidatus Falkowbacteria bacterium]|jgi:ParB family chromosome partitioning protein|nr:MAG: ParB-like protein partition protein [Candidatus Falkowbacteria bacterium GW2011_GWF2_43_32]HBA36902.1 chromosome partitioning protein ParB [Candidatus Falkowbacteria bacterium]
MPQGLGRGLGSLIPKKTVAYGQNPFKSDIAEEEVMVLRDGDRILKISPAKIIINPQQPRTNFSDNALNDLAESIRQHGIIQPLIVTRQGDRFELIAGERRWRAAQIVGLSEVPVIVREEKEQKKLELALIENLQREDLNPLETARAYQKLMDEFNITQEEVAKKVGKARSSVANALRLLSLPPAVQEALAAGKITEAHAKYLLGLEDAAKQLNMLKKILRQNLTVAQTDREIKKIGGTKAAKTKDYFDRAKEEELSGFLSTKVEIKRQGRGGQIMIDFYSEEELNEIVKKIK